MKENPKLLTISTVAKRLGISQGTLRIYADKGIILVITLPRGHRRFKPQDVERLRQEWGIDEPNSGKEQDA